MPLLKLPQWALRRELRVEKASTILESPPHEDLFSKPNDIKLNDSFPAKVRSREELIHDLQAVSDKYSHHDLDISLSSQIDFIREYRIIVINGKFGMSSIYRDDDGLKIIGLVKDVSSMPPERVFQDQDYLPIA